MNESVKKLLKKGEGERTEFKEHVPPRRVLGKTLCSFANASGGTIVLGVSGDGKVEGVPDAELVARALSRDTAKILSPPTSVSVNVVDVKGKDILLLDVPEGYDKPYTFARQIYVRRGNASRLAKVSELRELLSEAPRFEVRWERRLAGGLSEADLDSKEIDRLITSAQDKFGYSFQPNEERMGRLEELSFASHGQLHNSAVILFGLHPQHPFPQTRIRAIRFADDDESRILDNKVFEGHAFKLLQDAVQFIQSNISVSSTISEGGLDRRDETSLPLVALREAILNSIQHRDYEAYDGGIIIKITPRGVSIWNSGGLPQGMTIRELKGVHYSRPRNPDIAHAFFLRGFVERIGSGTSRILSALRSAGLPDAQWETVSGGLEIRFMYSRLGTKINDRQKNLLENLTEGESITLAEYAKRFANAVSERQARGDLSDLVKKGLIVKRGSARTTRYERTARRV